MQIHLHCITLHPRTSSTTGFCARGNTSKMKDSSLMPLLALGTAVAPSGSAYGIFFSATWYTVGGDAATACADKIKCDCK